MTKAFFKQLERAFMYLWNWNLMNIRIYTLLRDGIVFKQQKRILLVL